MLPKIVERKEYYKGLGGENNFILEDLQIMKHKQIPNAYFVKVKYVIGDGGMFEENDILEALDENGEWVNLKNKLSKLEYGAFLNDCEVCNF